MLVALISYASMITLEKDEKKILTLVHGRKFHLPGRRPWGQPVWAWADYGHVPSLLGQAVCGGAENLFFLVGGHVVCGVLVATPPSVELQSLNHWTATEVPGAEHHFLKRWEAGGCAAAVLSGFLPHLFRHPLSLFPCQQLSWLAPFAFRADSWLGQGPLFLLPRWHLSQFTLLWLLLWAHASFVSHVPHPPSSWTCLVCFSRRHKAFQNLKLETLSLSALPLNGILVNFSVLHYTECLEKNNWGRK